MLVGKGAMGGVWGDTPHPGAAAPYGAQAKGADAPARRLREHEARRYNRLAGIIGMGEFTG